MDALNPGTPDTSAMSPNQPAPQPTAPSPSPVTHSDMGSVSGAVGAVQQAAQPTPQPPQPQPNNGQPVQPQQSWWKTLLQGALNGLAGAGRAGAHSFGGGLGAGAAGQQQEQQQQFENQQAQARLQSDIKFRDVQSAQAAAVLARQDAAMHMQQEEMQQKHDEFALNLVKFMSSQYGIQYKPVPNTAANAKQYLQQATLNGAADGGAHVPGGIIASPSNFWVPEDDSENGPVKDYKFLSQMGPLFGLPVVSRQAFMQASPNLRRQWMQPLQYLIAGKDRNGAMLKGQGLADQVGQFTQSLQNYSSSPNADPDVLAQGQSTLGLLKAAQASDTDYSNQQFQKQRQLAADRYATLNQAKVLTVLGSDGMPHDFSFNSQSGHYDIDQGLSMKGAAGTEMAQANVVSRAGANLIADIAANSDKLGSLDTWVKSKGINTPIGDEDLARLQSELGTFAALQPAMHGFKGRNAAETFENIIGGLQKNPKATIASIRGILGTSGSILGPYSKLQQGNGGPVTPAQPGQPGQPGPAIKPPTNPAPQGRAVRDAKNNIIGYTTDGKTMTPVGQQ